MSDVAAPSWIPHDWFHGTVPSNVAIESGAYVESSRTFLRFRSTRDPGLVLAAGAALYNSTLDVGESGRVVIGEHALLSNSIILCDVEVTIGALTMFAWDVVIMDAYRGRIVRAADRAVRPAADPAPVSIGSNVWLGFGCCVLPGVTIGDGTVVAARSVVNRDLPPYCVAAGNPARVVRYFAENQR